MEMANDVLLAQLLSLGLELKQARAAVAAGNTTVEQATEWIFENSDSIGQQDYNPTPSSSTANSGTLRLRPEDDMEDLELQRAIELSTAPQEPVQPSPLAENKKPPIKINIIRAGQASQHSSSPAQPSKPVAQQQPGSSSTASAEGVTSMMSPSTGAKRERETDSASSTSVTPMLPLISSRQREAEFEAENARLKKEAEQLAEKSKRLKQLEREARQRALQAIREDRENLKGKHVTQPPAESTIASSTSPSNALSSKVSAEPPTARTATMVQLRLKNGKVLKRSFDNDTPLQQLFDAVIQEDPLLSGQDIRLIQPFPRREFGAPDANQTLQESGLCPSCSLNVHVPPSANPVSQPTPAATNPPAPMPGSWQPAMPVFGYNGTDEPEPMDIDEDSDAEYQPNEDEENEEDEGEEEEEEEEEENDDDLSNDEDDDMMHILPVGNGHGPPFGGGRGRGRGGLWAGNRGRGRGGMPFSGVGHRLSAASGPSGGPSGSSSSGAGGGGGDDDNDGGPSRPMSDAERRQRVLDAMAARAAQQSASTADATASSSTDTGLSPTSSSSARKKQSHKAGPARSIPSLLSRCTYEVAVLLSANDSKRIKYLKNLSEVGSQAAELIVQDLIRLNQLDQLTMKRMHRSPIVNLTLDGYSRATDSLMETLRWTQAQSLSYLSLRGCPLLTDVGFSQIAAFHELEHLDLSNCRFTDANLSHVLELNELRVLSLSSTKVTSRGIANAIPKAAWKKQLHTLDLSFCEGIEGPSVLIHLQELVNICNLRLNNTKAFNHGPIQVPDSQGFTRLQELDLARTLITDDDLRAIRRSFPALELLNLTGCSQLSDDSLEALCSEGQENMPELSSIRFPNRESPLRQVLPLVADQFEQLSQLDLTGFLNVTDDTLLQLTGAVNLTMLSLAGTKLTDAGSSVLADFKLLREIQLDRTAIQDKTIDHFRGLGRLEVISLSRCPGLTVNAIKLLSMSASFERTLKRLNLGYNTQIHDEALGYLEQAHALMSLNLEYTDVTTARAQRLRAASDALEQLRLVGVTEGERLEERGVYSIASQILANTQNNQQQNPDMFMG